MDQIRCSSVPDNSPRLLRVGLWCAVSARTQASDDEDSVAGQEPQPGLRLLAGG